MARKMRLMLVLLALGSLCTSVSSATDVGGTRKINETVLSVPANGTSLKCNTVALTTNTLTAVLTSHADRLAFWVVNRSTLAHCPDCSSINDRPSYVAITTGSTTNQTISGTGAGRSNFSKFNAKILPPCFITATTNGVTHNEPCKYEMVGGSVYTGALYGIAESSGTSGTDVLGRVEACELR